MKYLALAVMLACRILVQAQANHFWDGIEAFDGPTDHNPLMEKQLDFYFGSLVSPLPDSICVEIDRLLERPISTALRDFILWHLLERYQNPEYMTQDQVFIYLYDNYFSKLELTDLNEQNLTLIADKAERLRQLQLFHTAPNFNGKDAEGNPFSLQVCQSPFVVIIFFDHDCFNCIEELEALSKMDLQKIRVIAVDTHPESQIYDKRFININATDIHEDLFSLYDIQATPMIYVLDSDKRIVAKKIRANQIQMVIK